MFFGFILVRHSIKKICVMGFHLQHPGSESVIQQNVKAQNLKAGTAGGVGGKARMVIMLENGMS